MREEGEKRRGLRVKNKRKRKRQWPRFSNSYSLTRVALVDEGLHRHNFSFDQTSSMFTMIDKGKTDKREGCKQFRDIVSRLHREHGVALTTIASYNRRSSSLAYSLSLSLLFSPCFGFTWKRNSKLNEIPPDSGFTCQHFRRTKLATNMQILVCTLGRMRLRIQGG